MNKDLENLLNKTIKSVAFKRRNTELTLGFTDDSLLVIRPIKASPVSNSELRLAIVHKG